MKNAERPNDPLEELQRRIARRADELAAGSTLRTTLNLHWWTQAECDVLGSPPHAGMAATASDLAIPGEDER